MIIFLVLTAIYHSLFNMAIKPLIQNLPDDNYGASSDDQRTLRSTSNDDDLELTNSRKNASGKARPVKTPSKMANMLLKVWNPAKFKSHDVAQGQTTNFGQAVQYTPEEVREAYYNPAVTSQPKQLWIVHDEMGISEQEVKESGRVVPITDHGAAFEHGKSKVVWDSEVVQEAPIWEKRVHY